MQFMQILKIQQLFMLWISDVTWWIKESRVSSGVYLPRCLPAEETGLPSVTVWQQQHSYIEQSFGQYFFTIGELQSTLP